MKMTPLKCLRKVNKAERRYQGVLDKYVKARNMAFDMTPLDTTKESACTFNAIMRPHRKELIEAGNLLERAKRAKARREHRRETRLRTIKTRRSTC